MVFDVKKCAFTEIRIVKMNCPEVMLTSGSLLKATVDTSNGVFDQELFLRMVQDNAGL